ncbi:hypothetical protein OG992_33655 [Micromonospora sp. NBC_00362]|uniref:hypothetical protein n=1 Tax=Micromonospora sp. NBC_00362 TaxID=2975975 RepID=UPI002250933E|nr:hypothetical protein [Micromonospora sp. NBC_00362]MCX5122105.1 hypothetical protein [Micromonospora sp. NBC_00362]
MVTPEPDQPAPAATTAQAVRVEIPGKLAQHLADHADLEEAEQHALRRGRTVRRGQGYSLHVTALPEVHYALLAAAATLITAHRRLARDYETHRATSEAMIRWAALGGCSAASPEANPPPANNAAPSTHPTKSKVKRALRLPNR